METDWRRILSYYDELANLDKSPIVALNRAVALSFFKGPNAALTELKELMKDDVMEGYYLLPATMADFYRRLDDKEKAIQNYRKALQLAGTQAERRFLLKRLAELGVKEPD